jgi:hypothetical protein
LTIETFIGVFILGPLFAYALFTDEIEVEEEEPKLKAPKRPDIKKMKKNGQWVDVKVYNDK